MGFNTYNEIKKKESKKTNNSVKLNFAKHQSFYFREGWLRKGMLNVKQDPHFFLRDDASEILGLGVNMVKSLRYWMVATGMAIEKKDGSKMVQELTHLGEQIYKYDPYFELDGTLWIVHCILCSNYEQAPTWFWFFNKYAKALFDKEDFILNLDRWVLTQGKEVSERSLVRDFDCFVRTYLFSEGTPEDIMVCPLGHLGLLDVVESDKIESKGKRVFKFLKPDIKEIPPLIVGWCLKRWQHNNKKDINQVSFFEALREDCSPGRLFNLSTIGLIELINRLNEMYEDIGFKIIRTHGLDLIEMPDVTEDVYLQRYYEMEGLNEYVDI